MKLAKKQNYEEFYESEINIRKMMNYPPFTDIIVISSFANTNLEAKRIITNIYKLLEYSKADVEKTLINDEKLQIFKPQEYRINKLKNSYRWKVIIKANINNNISSWINQVIAYVKTPKNSYISVDLNPYNI